LAALFHPHLSAASPQITPPSRFALIPKKTPRSNFSFCPIALRALHERRQQLEPARAAVLPILPASIALATDFHLTHHPLSSRFNPAFAPVFLRSASSSNHNSRFTHSLCRPCNLFFLRACVPPCLLPKTNPPKAQQTYAKPFQPSRIATSRLFPATFF
jgi:hypothetical protein